MYRQAVRKPTGVQSRKREQVTQKASESASNSLSLQKIASQSGYEKGDRQHSGAAAKAPVNLTGLPGDLKAGVEALSGFSLDSVRVHYNSPEPKKLNARAYTRGTDIYVGTGQERSLPHEAWHVVQQLQDRVRPTKKINSFNVNDSVQLEREADIMGARALSASRGGSAAPAAAELSQGIVQCNDWKSTTLAFESQEALRERILGFGFNRAMDNDEDPDEYDDNYDQLNPTERELLRYSEGLRDMQTKGLAKSIHHMLSRKKLDEFYKTLNDRQKAEIKRRFSHSHRGIYVEQSDDSNSVREILFSLRSNLVLGPDGKDRIDDPAHREGGAENDFDPTFGEYARVSAIYEQIDNELTAIGNLNDEIINQLSEAERLYAEIQTRKGLRPDMLNTDVENLWEKVSVPKTNKAGKVIGYVERWRKRQPPILRIP